MPTLERQSIKYTFSGHESFQCRHLWLKKGYDFIDSGKSFNDEDAVLDLGVGKNMVAAIRFWMKAFAMTDSQDQLTSLAHNLLSDDGWDPYMEDEGTLWLLHYNLVASRLATTYHIVFNELRKEKIEFTKDNYVAYIKRKTESEGLSPISENTLYTDFGVLTKMYVKPEVKEKDREDSFAGLFAELNLIKEEKRRDDTDKLIDYYEITNHDRAEIPEEVVLYGILNMKGFESSINFSALSQEPNSPGSVFALDRSGLTKKIETIVSKYKDITYTDHAGVKELQFKKKYESLSILKTYYGK